MAFEPTRKDQLFTKRLFVEMMNFSWIAPCAAFISPSSTSCRAWPAPPEKEMSGS